MVFGRRLPFMRDSFRATSAGAPGQRPESSARRGALLTKAVVAAFARVLRFTYWLLRGVGRGIGRVFQRPPAAVRVPRLARPFPSVKLPSLSRIGRAARDASRHDVEPPSQAPDRQGLKVLDSRGEARMRLWRGRTEAAQTKTPVEPLMSDAVEVPPVLPVPSPPNILSEPASPVSEEPSALAESSSPAPSMQLEAHVRERKLGKQKVVGRVRTREHSVSEGRGSEERLVVGKVLSGLLDVPAMLEQGDLARAESTLVEHLSRNPRDLEAYRLLGLLYIQRGDFSQAKEVFEEALRRDPGKHSLYGPLGRTYVGLSQYSKALQMYQRAHNVDERNLEYLEQLLRIALRMDRRPLVRMTAEKILLLKPDHAEAKERLARVTAGG